MKKVISIACVALLLVSLAGCGSNKTTYGDTSLENQTLNQNAYLDINGAQIFAGDKVSKLKDLGYTYDDAQITPSIVNGVQSMSLYMGEATNGAGQQIGFSVANYEAKNLDIDDCYIDTLILNNDTSDPTIKIVGGIAIKSTLSDVKSAYGTPIDTELVADDDTLDYDEYYFTTPNSDYQIHFEFTGDQLINIYISR